VANQKKKGSLLGVKLTEEERREILESLFVFGKENQRPFLKRMTILLFLSTVIASCGLLSNSAAVVIGAMLIAPMMRPVMSSAGAIVMGWSARLYESLLLILAMTIVAIAIAVGIGLLAPDMVDIPDQIMYRTQPTYFDLIIALAAGAGGAYTMTRKESSAIPGVAMAVSLLPPLASCGILLVFRENELALRAFILFVTNFLAMTLASTIVFLIAGVSPGDKRRESGVFIGSMIFVLLILVIAISIPLYYYSNTVWFDDKYEAARSDILQSWLQENNQSLLDFKIDDKNKTFFLTLTGPKPPIWLGDLHTDLTRQMQEDGLEGDFKIELNWTRSVQINWPPPPAGEVEPEEIIGAALEKMKLLKNKKWGWKRTHYVGQVWSGTDSTGDYTVLFSGDEDLQVKTNCGEQTSMYSVSHGSLSITVPSPVEDCTTTELDAMFVADLNRVVDYRVFDDLLVLELGSGNGAMFFTPISQPAH
jgi:uncharacterized hydrophobic protein (TIGR00271 family)